jgi:hypothetical protein
MRSVTVTPDGKLTASAETIEKLRALCEADKAALAADRSEGVSERPRSRWPRPGWTTTASRPR